MPVLNGGVFNKSSYNQLSLASTQNVDITASMSGAGLTTATLQGSSIIYIGLPQVVNGILFNNSLYNTYPYNAVSVIQYGIVSQGTMSATIDSNAVVTISAASYPIKSNIPVVSTSIAGLYNAEIYNGNYFNHVSLSTVAKPTTTYYANGMYNTVPFNSYVYNQVKITNVINNNDSVVARLDTGLVTLSSVNIQGNSFIGKNVNGSTIYDGGFGANELGLYAYGYANYQVPQSTSNLVDLFIGLVVSADIVGQTLFVDAPWLQVYNDTTIVSADDELVIDIEEPVTYLL